MDKKSQKIHCVFTQSSLETTLIDAARHMRALLNCVDRLQQTPPPYALVTRPTADQKQGGDAEEFRIKITSLGTKSHTFVKQ
jgi:hypothetical protein